TIFLDEIGDLSQPLQAKLLRVLQEKEVQRVGANATIEVDVRVIAATNKDLDTLMKEDKFRPDLYYRLNVIQIHVPPLRERKEDVSSLVDNFTRKYSEREGKKIAGISAEAMNALINYSFPGNIRELENIIERAVVFCEGQTITSSDLPVFLKEKKEEELVQEGASLKEKVKNLEAREIKKALLENGSVKSKAARALGITERILSYKMKVYSISSGKKG
ncbi:MAG: sigma 54-interacting transcriptional regulator, partial [Candidatus Aminicenantes bacterium]|nr:sigma 54-interacting transcriptional regulator [Candidatus Aminicenantes bacterium]